MEILIGNKTPQIEQPGVSPICGEKEIGGARAGLQTRRKSFTTSVSQSGSPSRNLWAECDRCLGCPAFRVSPIEAILHEHHGIADSCSANGRCAWGVKAIGNHRNDQGQIKIAVEPPGEIEIALVRESGERSYGNTARNSRHQASCGKDRIVRNEAATGKQRWGRLRGGALRDGCRGKEQWEQRQGYFRKWPNETRISYSQQGFLQ